MRRFSGWEPRRETVHEYDQAGRLIRSVTTVEAEWDEQQRAHALALTDMRRLACPGCGGHLPDTTDPDNDGRYVADEPQQCHRCAALSTIRERYTDFPQADSLLFTVRHRS